MLDDMSIYQEHIAHTILLESLVIVNSFFEFTGYLNLKNREKAVIKTKAKTHNISKS